MNFANLLAQYNISVNYVAPALIVETGVAPDAKTVLDALEVLPLGRLGMSEKIAHIVTMFAKTWNVTGQSLLAAAGLRHTGEIA